MKYRFLLGVAGHMLTGVIIGFLVTGIPVLAGVETRAGALLAYGLVIGGGLGLIVGLARGVRPGVLPGFLSGLLAGLGLGLVSAVLITADYARQEAPKQVGVVFLLYVLWMTIPWGVVGAFLGGLIGAVRGMFVAD